MNKKILGLLFVIGTCYINDIFSFDNDDSTTIRSRERPTLIIVDEDRVRRTEERREYEEDYDDMLEPGDSKIFFPTSQLIINVFNWLRGC